MYPHFFLLLIFLLLAQVRYIPTDLQQLFEKDKVTFYYYYDQVHMNMMIMNTTMNMMMMMMLMTVNMMMTMTAMTQ